MYRKRNELHSLSLHWESFRSFSLQGMKRQCERNTFATSELILPLTNQRKTLTTLQRAQYNYIMGENIPRENMLPNRNIFIPRTCVTLSYS